MKSAAFRDVSLAAPWKFASKTVFRVQNGGSLRLVEVVSPKLA
jgi:hypothetical protein